MNGIGERLTALETKMIHLDKCMDETKAAVRALQRTVWQASGAVVSIISIIELLFKR